MEICELCKQFDATSLKLSLLGRELNPEWKRVGFYDSVLERPSWWNGSIPFSEECGLGTDTSGIFERFGEFQFYHVEIKIYAFSNFVKELKKVQQNLAVLPFWCLCDTDRYMILAVKKNFVKRFKSIWQIRPRNQISDGKRLKKINEPHQLAAAIYYIGQSNVNHYWINRPVYPHAELAMCTLFPEGFKKMYRLSISKEKRFGLA
ncbi:hypothetical protein AVEN_15708-1 [Araneus ventricosus]|uniref:Uncharacterized protein n=1 Tax=Araneus ventricosus TaxID=182803 RepID=A0A4Y2JN66_ARAVE|nr:hypothetical protein AVEN_15708-1 [Araneus ventricosus]